MGKVEYTSLPLDISFNIEHSPSRKEDAIEETVESDRSNTLIGRIENSLGCLKQGPIPFVGYLKKIMKNCFKKIKAIRVRIGQDQILFKKGVLPLIVYLIVLYIFKNIKSY